MKLNLEMVVIQNQTFQFFLTSFVNIIRLPKSFQYEFGDAENFIVICLEIRHTQAVIVIIRLL